MSTLEDIKKMQHEGKSEDEIIDFLQAQGTSLNEIQESLAQARIKDAVSEPQEGEERMTRSSSFNQGMEPSLLQGQDQDSQAQQDQIPIPEQAQDPQVQQIPSQGYSTQSYSDQYSYDSSINADTISEIADQVVAERISLLRTKIESALDVKALLDSKIESLDTRLQRIEKTLDRLQLSILQKVGDYMTNVDDIKRELQENQKSFKSLLSQKSPSSSDFKEID